MTRVLIVDDDADHAESLADVLDLRGHETEIAGSGEEALARFRAEEFDFVLLDVKLPGINGVDTFLEMRKIRPEAQVMMMTGFSVEQLVSQAVEGGALGVLHKPFGAAQVLAALGHIKPRSTVLVVDDDPEFVDSIVPVLQTAGYQVVIAHNGTDALEKILNDSVDCLLLDLSLPGLSGVELYTRLAQAGRSIPTIVVTGGWKGREQELRTTVPAEDMLFKPFDPNRLLRAVGVATGNAA